METALQVTPRAHDMVRTDRAAEPAAPTFDVRPAFDVLENDDGFRVLFDVPGVAPEDVDARIEMPHLRIAATRTLPGGARARYVTALALPDTIDPGTLSAELRNGVLEIGMAKRAAARPRRIEVRSA